MSEIGTRAAAICSSVTGVAADARTTVRELALRRLLKVRATTAAARVDDARDADMVCVIRAGKCGG